MQWTGKPVKNVTKTPLVAGQWQRKGDQFELVITANQPGAEHSGRRQAGVAVVGAATSPSCEATSKRRLEDGAQSAVYFEIAPLAPQHDRERRAECNAAILTLEKISKRFGAVVVADGIDLALAEGEALGIIGPNGAGKTTLFGIITGTVAPDAGRVLFDGRDITPRRRRSGAAAWASRARSRSRSRSAA